MKIFVCSDTHFGHANIIRYCSRPFANANDMDNALIERWNSRVSEADIVYFLGDFAFTSIDRMKEIFARLHFSACYFVPGNHDKKLKDYWEFSLCDRIDRVEAIRSVDEAKIDGRHFVLCHYPMESWDRSFHGSIHLHGHCHSTPGNIKPSRLENRYDIGVDMYGGPVQLTGDLRYLNDPKGWN